jgi:hypothetical protein
LRVGAVDSSAGKTKSARDAGGVIRRGGRGPFQHDLRGARILLKGDAGAVFRGAGELCAVVVPEDVFLGAGEMGALEVAGVVNLAARDGLK